MIFIEKDTILFVCKIHAFYPENTCQNEITVGAKARQEVGKSNVRHLLYSILIQL